MEGFRKESLLNTVVGGTESEKNKLLDSQKDKFEDTTLQKHEREKFPEEQELVNNLLPKVKDFLAEYQVEAIDLQEFHIRLWSKNQRSQTELESRGLQKSSGYIQPGREYITILPPGQRSKLKLAETLVHETMHYNSFHSATILSDEIKERRAGLMIITKDAQRLMEDLNEAITSELAKRFDRKYFDQEPILKKEIEQKQKVLEFDESNQKFLEDMLEAYKFKRDNKTVYAIYTYPYEEERARLWQIIHKIFKNNEVEFNSEEDVFRIFTQSYFQGKLLPLARLLKQTFGDNAIENLSSGLKID